MLGGGVAANSLLRERFLARVHRDRHPRVPAEPGDVHRQRGDDRRRRVAPIAQRRPDVARCGAYPNLRLHVPPVSARIEAFVVATPGLEPLVQAELVKLGRAPGQRHARRRRTARSPGRSCGRSTSSRASATRVLVRVARFKADGFDTLACRAGADRLVRSGCREGGVDGVGVDRRQVEAVPHRRDRRARGRPRSAAARATQQVLVRVQRDVATVSLDASGRGAAPARLSRPGRQGADARDAGRGAAASPRVGRAPAAGRPVLRVGHDPDRGRDARPAHGARAPSLVPVHAVAVVRRRRLGASREGCRQRRHRALPADHRLRPRRRRGGGVDGQRGDGRRGRQRRGRAPLGVATWSCRRAPGGW